MVMFPASAWAPLEAPPRTTASASPARLVNPIEVGAETPWMATTSAPSSVSIAIDFTGAAGPVTVWVPLPRQLSASAPGPSLIGSPVSVTV